MGVPISFYDKYCMDQFKILGQCGHLKIDGQTKYKRLIIQRIV